MRAPHDLRVGVAPQLAHDQVEGEGRQLLQAHDGHLAALALLLALSRQLIVQLRREARCQPCITP